MEFIKLMEGNSCKVFRVKVLYQNP